jgi:hypothetical protein
MNFPKPHCFYLGSILAGLTVQAQGTFQNLNFELADPGQFSSFSVPISSALPGWTVAIGGVQQADVGYNAFSTGAPFVSLIGPGHGPLDGNYSVLLTGSAAPTATAAISQTAGIPSGTESLYFDAQQGTGGAANGVLQVMVGSQIVQITPLTIEPNYTEYGANISAWGGDTEQLTFTALGTTSGLNNWEIDDISFSTQSVPEPTPLILTGLGAVVFALYRRFAPKRT